MAILKWLRLPISISTDRTKSLSWGEEYGRLEENKTLVIILAVCSPRPIKRETL